MSGTDLSQPALGTRTTLKLGAFIVALPMLLFLPQTIGMRTFFHHDLQHYFYPYHHVAWEAVRARELPLWNRFAFAGVPLLGDGQTAMLFPTNWGHLLLNDWHAMSLSIVLDFSLAGLGMVLFLRSMKLSLLPVLLGSIGFMLSGFMTARITHPSILAGAAMIPWAFWSMDRLLARPTISAIITAIVCVALQLVSGHPQIPAYTAIALAIYLLSIAALRGLRPAALVWIVIVYSGGAALAAVQLVPWYELIRQSPRAAAASYEFVTLDSITNVGWLLMLFPYAVGGMTTNWLQTGAQWDVLSYSWERLGYPGVVPTVFALIGAALALRQARANPRRAAIALVLFVMLLVAAGSGTPLGRLVYAVPLVGKLRCYSRAVGVAGFALAALSAFGLQWLLQNHKRIRTVVFVAVGLLIVQALCLLVPVVFEPGSIVADSVQPVPALPLVAKCLRVSQTNFLVPAGFTVLLIASLVILRRRSPTVLAAVLCGLSALDLGALTVTYAPTVAVSAIDRVPESVKFLRADPDVFRVVVLLGDDRIPTTQAQNQLAVSWAMAYGIEDVNGFNSLQPRRHMEALFGPSALDISYGVLPDHNGTLLDASSPWLKPFNVKYALVPATFKLASSRDWKEAYRDEDVVIYRNPRFVPRAWLVRQVVSGVAPATILQLAGSAGFPSDRTALIADSLDEAVESQANVTGSAEVSVRRNSPTEIVPVLPTAAYDPYEPPAKVSYRRLSNREVIIEGETDRRRFLMVSETDFPGWRAELRRPDGTATDLPIHRTNHYFRGMVVPEGTWTIHMTYEPLSVRVGAWISGATLAVLLVAGLLAVFKGRGAFVR